MRVLWLILPAAVLALTGCGRHPAKAPEARQTITIDKLGEPAPGPMPKGSGGKLAVLPADQGLPAPARPAPRQAQRQQPAADRPEESDPSLAADCHEAERIADPFAESRVCRRILGR